MTYRELAGLVECLERKMGSQPDHAQTRASLRSCLNRSHRAFLWLSGGIRSSRIQEVKNCATANPATGTSMIQQHPRDLPIFRCRPDLDKGIPIWRESLAWAWDTPRARFQEKLRPGIPRRRDMWAPMGMPLGYTFPGAFIATAAIFLYSFPFAGVLALVPPSNVKAPTAGAFLDRMTSVLRPCPCRRTLRLGEPLPGDQG